MSWVSGLKEWNAGKGTWCIPKKGTKEHAEVMEIIKRKKAPVPPASQTKEEKDEDARVAKMRLYLAQRKAFSRLKDPIRDKLEAANIKRLEDKDAMYDWKEELKSLVEKWHKSQSYKAIEAIVDARPGTNSRYIDPKDLLNPTTDELKKAAASKYGKLIVAHLNKKPVIAEDVGERFNTKPGRDELGIKDASGRNTRRFYWPGEM